MFLTEVQQSVARYLSGHDFFAADPPIPVVAQNDKDLLPKMSAAVGTLGLAVMVAPLSGDHGLPEIPTPYYNGAKFVCRVRENIPINRTDTGTGQPADYVAEVCGCLLKNYVPLGTEGQTLTGGGIVLVAIQPGDDVPGITAWDLIFSLSGGLMHEPVRREFDTFPDPET